MLELMHAGFVQGSLIIVKYIALMALLCMPADPLKQQQPGPGQYPEVPAAITHPAPPAVSISHRLQGSREAERRPAPGEARGSTCLQERCVQLSLTKLQCWQDSCKSDRDKGSSEAERRPAPGEARCSTCLQE